jgi:Cys-tRNA synthase (O-phospho-L-seryl-tRNA:Cys-tRNA synthase)
MQTTVSGAPATVSVNLEDSLAAAGPWAVLANSTSTTGDVQTASGKAVRYVRANLVTLTGGTAPTVTALIASAQ